MTLGNVHDSTMFKSLMENVMDNAGKPSTVVADAYLYCHEPEEDGQLAMENAKNGLNNRAGEVCLGRRYQII